MFMGIILLPIALGLHCKVNVSQYGKFTVPGILFLWMTMYLETWLLKINKQYKQVID